jgi:hypothetical protein
MDKKFSKEIEVLKNNGNVQNENLSKSNKKHSGNVTNRPAQSEKGYQGLKTRSRKHYTQTAIKKKNKIPSTIFRNSGI